MFHAAALWFKFQAGLLEIDRVAADRIRAQRCPSDGGRLDVANYPRKVRGLSADADDGGGYAVRLSFCCAVDGCRRRATPPSVRFLGRRVYAAVVVILASCSPKIAVESSPPASPPPTRQTLGRWRSFWREKLASSAMYIEFVASRMAAPIAHPDLPDALLEQFAGDVAKRLESMLRLLAPWTTISVPPESARSVMVR